MQVVSIRFPSCILCYSPLHFHCTVAMKWIWSKLQIYYSLCSRNDFFRLFCVGFLWVLQLLFSRATTNLTEEDKQGIATVIFLQTDLSQNHQLTYEQQTISANANVYSSRHTFFYILLRYPCLTSMLPCLSGKMIRFAFTLYYTSYNVVTVINLGLAQ